MSEAPLGALAAATGVAALVAGFLRGSVGGGIGLALTPLLSVFFPAHAVLGLTAFLLNLADPIILRYYWGQWERALLWRVLPGVLLGILAGTALAAALSDYRLKKAIGAAVLALALLQLVLLGRRVTLGRLARGWTVASGAGLLTGIASAVANSGGTILGPYLAGLGLGNAAVVATGSGALVFSNTLKVVAFWWVGFLTWPLVVLGLAATPALYLGAWLGYRLNAYLPRRAFLLALIAIALAGSLKLLIGVRS